MLIHSVTPVHLLTPKAELPSTSIRAVNGRFLEGTDTPQGFCLSRIHSTDPADYLRSDFSPGNIYHG